MVVWTLSWGRLEECLDKTKMMVVFSKDWPYGSNRGAITELDDMSQAVMDIIRVISKDFQAHGNCL